MLHTILNRTDVYLESHRYSDALSDYQRAANLLCTPTQRVRALIGIAKTTYRLTPKSAEEDWLKVESLVAELGWGEGFAYGLIKLSLGVLTDDPARIAISTGILYKQELAAWLVGGRSWVQWINKPSYIHIAGTKGKGTTCLYTENLIRTHNHRAGKASKVGCLTSPHVTTVRERIRLNAQPITEESFAFHFWTLWEKMRSAEPPVRPHVVLPPMLGYPGFVALLAFHIFAEEAVDVAILERGMGGETDSTNVITSPIATGITELGLDHTNRLGNKLESIAWHKSGIFKPGVPAFSVPQREAAARVLRDRAREKGVELHFVDDTFLTDNHIKIAPNERFQRHNASLALTLAGAYVKSLSTQSYVGPEDAHCLEQTSLPAKFEVMT
ncbi:hypothetical protein LTR17_011411 [Elasticomyces elasticus]|nr:hypothetical protein LTR17_011411 [Elasticomyces elasticus]